MKNKFTRRQFTAMLGAGGAAAALSACAGDPQAPAIAKVGTGPRVVVVGGGFGGTTAAKYIKRLDPSIHVTLIEPNQSFFTCPFSNTVIGGINTMRTIQHRYDVVAQKHGVVMVHQQAVNIDPVGRKVVTQNGEFFPYDRLIVSPGIDFKWNAVPGYDENASRLMPHGWKAGEQTQMLRERLEAMPDGGVFVIAPPANPYRCPPGPYERASLVAHYFKLAKPKSKILILDPKDSFSKQKLFEEGWKKLYGNMIEWVPGSKNGTVKRVDTNTMTLETDFDKHRGHVVNFIPPQKAGAIATATGLADQSGFCPVNPESFESTLVKGIHVIGDSCIAGAMPKSAFSANSQGKACAKAVVSLLRGQPVFPPLLMNTCYSLLASNYAVSVAGVYEVKDGKIVEVPNSGGVSPLGASQEFRTKEADFAGGWYASIIRDTFGL